MKALVISALSLLAFSSLTFAEDKKDTAPGTAQNTAQKDTEKDIVQTATAAGNFKTLVSALQAAGLDETLKGNGPFTVFAPTDEAFAKLPAGTLDDLMKPENKEKLANILKYHVVSGKVMAASAMTMDKATALNKQDIKLATMDKNLVLNGTAKVTTPDLEASNGVIHVVDSVILPPAQ